jgi:hypothetical protein
MSCDFVEKPPPPEQPQHAALHGPCDLARTLGGDRDGFVDADFAGRALAEDPESAH